jgi:hypothetical protein
MIRQIRRPAAEYRRARSKAHSYLLTVLFLTVACLTPGLVWAHGGGPGLDYDACVRGVEMEHFVHFAAYQPQYNPFAEYCGSLPRAGKTLLVFDLMGADLPNLPVSIEVIGEGGVRRVFAPARRYRTGVIDLEADLPPGKYTAVVSIEEPAGHHQIIFPLSVGTWWGRLAGPAIIMLLILFATAAYCLSQVRARAADRQRTLKKAPEIPRRFA